VERDDLASVAGFFAGAQPLAPRSTAVLGEEAAHHARVRRLEAGDRVFVTDGTGARGTGSIVRLAKKEIEIAVEDVDRIPRLPEVHLLVPVADRDRMLWCAEKCAELGVTSWRPVMWSRSRSVSPRGEGDAFRNRVRGRMQSALIQSRGSWLPEVTDDATPDRALAILPAAGIRLALDASGDPVGAAQMRAPVTLAIGPEGGFEPVELEELRDARFRTVSLGANVLRFETAAVAAVAIVRAALGASPETING
jgi:16S rRNA (uracil1498-N3)-methyltransferase